MRRLALLVLLCLTLFAQRAKWTGPRPDKPDIPYLLHAQKLVPAETGEARQQEGKEETTYLLSGPTSPVRTPLAEPIFLLESAKLNPDKLSLFKMDVKSGQRSLTLSGGKRAKNNQKPVFILVTRLDGSLYKVEVNEYLENGEYCLSPESSNQVFCFTVY
jgi:hypothetical protein